MEKITGLIRDFVVAVAAVLVMAGIITDEFAQRITSGIVLLIVTGLALGTYAYNTWQHRGHTH